MIYVGDVRAGSIVRGVFNTFAVAGESITRATNGTMLVYKDDSVSQGVSGITDNEDFDSLTGLHMWEIDTSADGAFYSAGSDFFVVLTGMVVDGKTLHVCVGHFSIENRSALMPTTAGRKLDVSAGGEAGIDWANIGSPTTAVNLSATNIDVDQVVASVSGAVGSVTAGVGLSAAAISAIWDALLTGITTAGSIGKLLKDNIDAQISTRGTIANQSTISGQITTIDGKLPATLSGGKMRAQVEGMDANVITNSAIEPDAIGASEISASAAQEIADALLDRADAVETGFTPRQTLRALAAALAGLVSGATGGPATVVFKAIGAGSGGTTRITAEVDASGNRTSVTLNI